MTTTFEQEIILQEEQLANAKRMLDIDAIDRIYADDLLQTGVMGEPTCTKAAIIDEIKRGISERERSLASGQQVELTSRNEDMKVVKHGDTAIANYRFVVTVKGANIQANHRYRVTNTWMKRNGRWQIVAAHTAFVLDPKQAAMLSGQG
jgi:ketosteroid isomerase-like protein